MRKPTFILSIGLSGVLLALAFASCNGGTPSPIPMDTALPTETRVEASPTAIPTARPVVTIPPDSSAILLSLTDAGHTHLFAFLPDSASILRLTEGAWDDLSPATSPDGDRVAFSSNRTGYRDIYLLSLSTGEVAQLTDTPEYEGAPSWSPDGRWLVYETYVDDNLELFVRQVDDPTQAPIRVTQDAYADRSPSWSPLGRQVAFVSNRSGEDEIWIADLDKTGEERFTNLSHSARSMESHPVWSADGTRLAWSSASWESGISGILVWDSSTPAKPATWLGGGDWAVWMGPERLASGYSTPNENFIVVFSFPSGGLSLPAIRLTGSLRGMAYLPEGLPTPLATPFQQAATLNPEPIYQAQVNPDPAIPAGRATLVDIPNIQAAYPQLQDAVDESFTALRERVALATGWDALATLDNAYVPLTTPLDPGLGEDWLFTGRAFSLNPLLVNAGWVAVVREDDGQQTYWRVYLRTVAQDGSMGLPLTQIPWDFNSRYNGDPSIYEQGGNLMGSVPNGYWVDLTALALQYGWERQPALANWRTFFNGVRLAEFAMTDGLDWRSAMLELYPEDIFITPTAIIPPSRTPTRTPWGWVTPTPSRTPTPRPTYTPQP